MCVAPQDDTKPLEKTTPSTVPIATKAVLALPGLDKGFSDGSSKAVVLRAALTVQVQSAASEGSGRVAGGTCGRRCRGGAY